jgi:hypothetical protein
MADEEGFLSLLIANERVGRALDVLCDPFQRNKWVCRVPLLKAGWHTGAAAATPAAAQSPAAAAAAAAATAAQ